MFGPEREPEGNAELLLYLTFLIVIVGLFAGEVWFNYEPGKLAALFFLLFWVPLLALHEFSHAVAAWLVNWHVGVIVIGVGKSVGGFLCGGTPVEIRLFPVEGFIRSAPLDLNNPRLKDAFIYFAGPGSEVLVALAVLALVGTDRLFAPAEDVATLAWQSLAAAAATGAFLNLIPHGIPTPNGFIANDGLGILRSFTRPLQDYADMLPPDRRAYPRRFRNRGEH